MAASVSSLCGKRLLHTVIDERAASGHPRPVASIPRSSSKVEDGYLDISYAVLANAINRLATWIINEIGPPETDCEHLVYIAALDYRYQILIMAAIKAGYVTCLLSPRNSKDAFDALLKASGATKLLSTDPPSPAIPGLMARGGMKLFTIPSLTALLDETPVPDVALDVTWEQWRFRPFVTIHSSGSTGTPKLVTLNHGSWTAADAIQLLGNGELFQRFGNMRVFSPLPQFHVAGIAYGLVIPIWVDATPVLAPSSPLTADLVNQIHVRAGVKGCLLPPSILVDLVKTPEYYQNLIKLERVVFSGGPLPESTGREIAKHTAVAPGYGATEWIAVPQKVKDPEDWAYFHFNEAEGGLDFRERDNGLFEMVITRKQFPHAQAVFVTFPDIDEFASKDLFAKHPTKPGLWKYTSRWDDIIVFSNGEKLNPVTFEGIVSGSPVVKGCVAIGSGRFQSSLLVEPVEGNISEDELRTRIWPYIQRANEPTVRHGRVSKDCVFFTSPEKPLPRAGKGTIQRAAANALDAAETDALYDKILGAAPSKPIEASQSSTGKVVLESLESTIASLRNFLTEELGLEGAEDTDDFFALGMDSLQVVNIVRAINAVRADDPIDAKRVYGHPSIAELARSLHSGHVNKYTHDDDSDDEELKESWLAMEEIFQDLRTQIAPSTRKTRRRRALNGWLKSDSTGPVLPPDGGRLAWLQVLAMALVNFNNFGLVNSFGIFQAYYETTLLRGSSATAVAFIGTLQGALLLIVGVVSGPLFDKGYFKPTLVVASLTLVFALMMLSLSHRYYQVMLTQGVLLGIASGLLYIPSIALVPVYFKRRRGLALGLATGGGSIGGVIYPIVFRRLFSEVGFPWAVRVIGFIALVTLGAAAILSKPIGARIQRNLIEAAAFRDRPYIIFLVSAFFLLMAMFVPFFLVASYSLQQLHTGSNLSFYLISVINAAQFFGRVVTAWSADYHHAVFGPEAFQLLAEFFMGVLGFAWIGVDNVGGYVPWLIFYGLFSGMAVTLPAVVLPYISPSLAVYGTRIGMLYACAGVGLLISTPIASALNSSTGGFLGSQFWTGACCIFASIVFLGTALEARKRRLQMEIGKRWRRGVQNPGLRAWRMDLFKYVMTVELAPKTSKTEGRIGRRAGQRASDRLPISETNSKGTGSSRR